MLENLFQRFQHTLDEDIIHRFGLVFHLSKLIQLPACIDLIRSVGMEERESRLESSRPAVGRRQTLKMMEMRTTKTGERGGEGEKEREAAVKKERAGGTAGMFVGRVVSGANQGQCGVTTACYSTPLRPNTKNSPTPSQINRPSI
ncbi:unnamed protein product [Leuciscus chuanchicus]